MRKCKVTNCSKPVKKYIYNNIFKGYGIYCEKHTNSKYSRSLWQLGENNPSYKHGKTNKLIYCLDCGKKISGFRSLRCRSCSKKGDKSPGWRGGTDSELHRLRCSKEYQIWREGIFQRDNYICQGCGYDEGGILQAHHILSFTKFTNKRFDLVNGITLCIVCHQKIHPEVNLFKNV